MHTFEAMKLPGFILLLCLLWAGPLRAGNPAPALTPEQARARLADLTGFLNQELHLQPRQLLALRQYAGQELKLYLALAQLQAATGGLPPQGFVSLPGEEAAPPLPYLDEALRPVLSPAQRAAFEHLKNDCRLVELLQSPVFVR